MNSVARLVLALTVCVVMAAGCSSPPKKVEATPPVPVSVSTTWVKTELFFSIGDWTETAMSTDAENKWIGFLDTEVTPRFPEGLSVIDVYGQWRSSKAGVAVSRERSRLLVIVHRETQEASAKIEAIRSAWKAVSGESSVLRISQPVDASF
ncbi:MAG: DUF3574 domain-containing protein [Rariglobus sp.]